MKHLYLVLLLAVAAGCASVGRKIDQSKVDQIKKGETTRDQVLKSLGSPDQITKTGDGNVTFLYLYSHASAKGATFIPVVGAFAGGANVQSQFLRVTFGGDGIVSDFASTVTSTETGMGADAGSKPDSTAVEANKRPK
jgi:outer membrane protein assembly factor BamE (lipoprotein component of BamABCDE complex)